jgi:Na+-translocating ferredoxin:NAD+ oxidoreductase RnfG subunit
MNKTQASLLFLGPVVALIAHSEVYMSEDQAIKSLFPQDIFKKESLDLTADESAQITKKSGAEPRSSKVNVWKSPKKNYVFIDQVLGKHEFITYAVGIDSQGKVSGIEILDYRESYGSQIKGKEWRDQFQGKDANSTLKLNDDVKNISGATLSSAHVTVGVKRILQTYETIRSRL